MRADRRQAGFTLLELIVALTILGLISLELFGSLRFGATAWRRGQVSESNLEAIDLAESTLRQFLAGIYPMYSTDDPAAPHLLFEGSTNRLSFLAAAPQALGGAGLARFTLAIEPGATGLRVTLAAVPELALNEDSGLTPSLVVDGLERAALAYWGADDASSPPAWHDSWSNARALPSLVRIQASYPAGDPRRWTDLIVAPLIAADEACLFDLRTRHCQGRS
jgi:general secretion pathway protein J